MKTAEATSLRPIFWHDGRVVLMDQTRLPQEEVWLELTDFRDVIGAIQDMQIRGAPAIGVAGAYAVSLAAAELGHCGIDEFMAKLERAAEDIRAARPTGANLAWAVDRMMLVAHETNSVESAVDGLVAEAAKYPEPGRAGQPDNRPPRRGAGNLRQQRVDPLQRGRAGHGGPRHCAGRDKDSLGSGAALPRLCHGDTASGSRARDLPGGSLPARGSKRP